jgi:hypothetical protein
LRRADVIQRLSQLLLGKLQRLGRTLAIAARRRQDQKQD